MKKGAAGAEPKTEAKSGNVEIENTASGSPHSQGEGSDKSSVALKEKEVYNQDDTEGSEMDIGHNSEEHNIAMKDDNPYALTENEQWNGQCIAEASGISRYGI